MSDLERDKDSIVDEEKLDSAENMDEDMDSDPYDPDYRESEESVSEVEEELDSEANIDTDMDSDDSDYEDSDEEEEIDTVKELKSLLSAMSAQTNKATESMLSKDEEIREYCTSLRIKVDAQTEVMIEEIRQWNVDTRDRINKYEKECLDKFNAEQFEASSSVVKSLLAEITEHQNRIEQHIKDANSDMKKFYEIFDETSAKIQELELANLKLRKQKFSDLMLDVVIDEKKTIDPRATLFESTMFSLESMQYVSTIRDMPGFKRLSYCFINPFAASHELIAIVEKSKKQHVVVKMDASGKILKERTYNKFDARYGIRYLQTVKDFFIFEDSEGQYKRFNYNLYEHKNKEVDVDYIEPGFAANQWHIFNANINVYFINGPQQIYINKHDLSKTIDRVPDDCDLKKIDQMLASDKYLYIWHHGNRVRVVDINCDESKAKFENTYLNCKMVDDKPFESGYSSVKLLGDQYIAVHNKENATVCLYTQDAKVDKVKEYQVDLEKKYKMSSDSSKGFCFFTLRGHIYHTLI